jgi:hypothetical protein
MTTKGLREMADIKTLSRCEHGSEIKERSIKFLLELVDMVKAGDVAAITIVAMNNDGEVRVLDPFVSESPV